MLNKLIVFLSLVLCCLFVQPVYADTVVTYDLSGLGVGSFQFEVLEAGLDNTDFSATVPGGWMNMPSDDIVAIFDMTGTSSLTSGTMGSFVDDDVALGNWELGDQSATEVTDYTVTFTAGVGYHVAAIPIPGAFLLLASGLIGLVGIRRFSK